MRVPATLLLGGLLTVAATAGADGGHRHHRDPVAAAREDAAHEPPRARHPVPARVHHVELLVGAAEVRVSLLGAGRVPVPPAGVVGRVEIIADDAAIAGVDLAARGTSLVAPLALAARARFTVALALRVDGTPLDARFAIDREALAGASGGAVAARASAGEAHAAEGVAPRVVIGEIVDAACARARVDGTEAVRCLRDGAAPLVRDEATGRLWLVAPAGGPGAPDTARLLAHVGKRVRLAGAVVEHDGLLAIDAAEVALEHDHDAAPNGGVVGMAGERHVEVVAPVGGELRVFLLDAFMQPLAVGDVTGSVRIRAKDGTERAAPLAARADGRFLAAGGDRRRAGDDDVTVDLRLGGERLEMTLPFPDEDDMETGDGSGAAACH